MVWRNVGFHGIGRGLMGNVVQLRRESRKATPSLVDLVNHLRILAKDSDNMGFLNPHVRERMKVRGKTMREVLEVLKKGEGVKGPDLDEFGDYRIKLRRCVCGKRTQVVVAVREHDFSVITVI
jgi:Domain of unknown function (DUF4258)